MMVASAVKELTILPFSMLCFCKCYIQLGPLLQLPPESLRKGDKGLGCFHFVGAVLKEQLLPSVWQSLSLACLVHMSRVYPVPAFKLEVDERIAENWI